MTKKKYTSLDKIIKSKDYPELVEELKRWEENGELKSLLKTTTDDPVSQLDQLLYIIPDYAIKNSEDGKPTNDLADGLLEAVGTMLKYGANPNTTVKPKNGINTFIKACTVDNPALVELLVNNIHMPADVDHHDNKGNSGLYYSVIAESTNVLEYLVKEHKLNMDEKNFFDQDCTVFHHACGHMKEKSIDKLMELGANPNILDREGNLPQHMVPAFDPEEDDIESMDLVEMAQWDATFEKVKKYAEEFKSTNAAAYKVKF